MNMEDLFEDEIPEKTLAQIRAARSFYGHENFATYLKSLSEDGTLANLSKIKFAMLPYLEHSNQRSLTSNISPKNGPEIVKKNDFWEYLLPE